MSGAHHPLPRCVRPQQRSHLSTRTSQIMGAASVHTACTALYTCNSDGSSRSEAGTFSEHYIFVGSTLPAASMVLHVGLCIVQLEIIATAIACHPCSRVTAGA